MFPSLLSLISIYFFTVSVYLEYFVFKARLKNTTQNHNNNQIQHTQKLESPQFYIHANLVLSEVSAIAFLLHFSWWRRQSDGGQRTNVTRDTPRHHQDGSAGTSTRTRSGPLTTLTLHTTTVTRGEQNGRAQGSVTNGQQREGKTRPLSLRASSCQRKTSSSTTTPWKAWKDS